MNESKSMKLFFFQRKKLLLYSLASLLLFFLLFNYLSYKISIAFTVKGQECFPYRFWLIRKGVVPERGEYVAFKNHKVGGRATWIKIISGKEGDRVEVIELSGKEQFRVFFDEIGRELTVRGYVFLHSIDPLNDSQVFETFEKDTKVRDLPMIEEGRIPEGKYFVSSPAVRSYDSRYWGLVDESEIIGKAYPIF